MGTQIRAGWYVTTPFCPEVVFATEQEALAYGRTEELRQELMDRVRAMSFDELRALTRIIHEIVHLEPAAVIIDNEDAIPQLDGTATAKTAQTDHVAAQLVARTFHRARRVMSPAVT